MLEHFTLGRIDPEAAQLLREIASKPDSILFCRGSHQPVGFPDELTPMPSRRHAAEQHLYRIYREEVGSVLHELALRIVLDGCAQFAEVNCIYSNTNDGQPRSSAELTESLGTFESSLHADKEQSQDVAAALQIPQSDPSVHSVLTLAQRLVPSPATRFTAALDAIHRAQPALAVRHLSSLRMDELSATHKFVFHANAATALMLTGKPQEALASAEQAYGYSSEPAQAFAAFLASLIGGATAKASRFAELIARDHASWSPDRVSKSFLGLASRAGVAALALRQLEALPKSVQIQASSLMCLWPTDTPS